MSFSGEARRIYRLPDEAAGIVERRGSIFDKSSLFREKELTPPTTNSHPATQAQIAALLEHIKNKSSE